MRKLAVHPLFLVGLGLRLVLVGVVSPAPVTEWYVPFIDASLSSLTLDPWATWLAQGGTLVAFPYGYVMWLCFLPLTLVCKALGLPLMVGYGATLIAADVGLLFVLQQMLPGRARLLLATYWLSPIVLVASYVLALNDLVPVVFFVLSLLLIRRQRLLASGLACVAAVSAKLSMVLALPFFFIYLLHNRALRQLLPQFLKGLLIGVVLVGLPFALSDAGISMLFNNPEMGKVYRLAVPLGGGIQIYVVPLAYLLMLYTAWRVRRLNFELFLAMLGTAFLLVVLMTPSSPGWFIWVLPFLVIYQASSDRVAIAITSVFALLYVVSSLFLAPEFRLTSALFDSSAVMLGALQLPAALDEKLASLVHTAMVAAGMVLGVRMWRETVSRNDYFRLSRKPFVIGVAGDSGSGKDTFADAITGLFGRHSVTTISGDDYHLWDRQQPMWQVMTHLNPKANDLETFATDLVALIDGKSVVSRHYDHQTGRLSHPGVIRSNDLIIASGLHALYLPILRQCYGLSVFLDIDEGLRRHFKLERDVAQRGHTVERVLAGFDRREPDAARFVRPQSAYADLVLSLQPIHPRMLREGGTDTPLRFKLVVLSRHGLNEVSLTRALVGVCGLHVDMAASSDASEVELVIEGDASAQDVALAAQMVCPRILEFLDIKPRWHDGVLGLMQLVALSHINQALIKRFI